MQILFNMILIKSLTKNFNCTYVIYKYVLYLYYTFSIYPIISFGHNLIRESKLQNSYD